MEQITITAQHGSEYLFYKTSRDVSGNPRYIVSFMALGMLKYRSTKLTRLAGLRKYSGKQFGGGFVFTSHNLQIEANHFEQMHLCRPAGTDANGDIVWPGDYMKFTENEEPKQIQVLNGKPYGSHHLRLGVIVPNPKHVPV